MELAATNRLIAHEDSRIIARKRAAFHGARALRGASGVLPNMDVRFEFV